MSGPVTVVVVDDAPDVRLLVRTRLRLSGAFDVVDEGASGHDAVELARTHRPELLLLDVSMAGMDGLEALPLIAAESPGTRVVVYSGFEEQGLADAALRQGAAAFIEKSRPIDELPGDLLAVLGRPRPDTSGTSATDTSDQRVLDEHLERFREVFDDAAIGMATVTLAGHVVRANAALARLLGREVDDLVGRALDDLLDEDDDAEAIRDTLESIGQERRDVVQLERAVRPTGAVVGPGRRVLTTLSPVRDSSGRELYLFLQLQDVTEQRRAEGALGLSEQRFRLLVEAVQDYAIFMLDTDGVIASWNIGAQRSKGYRADEIVGQHFRVFYPQELQDARHPEHELVLALRDGHYEEEGWRIRKDGSRFWANVVITAVHDHDGRHVGFAKVTRDGTERRRLQQEREAAAAALAEANAELEDLNGRLRQTADDQAHFLAVTAHELRTPVGVLAGSAQTLAQHWTELEPAEREEMLEGVDRSAARLRRLLADLVMASRLGAHAVELDLAPVDVVDLLRATVAEVRQAVPDAHVHLAVEPGTVVVADRLRIGQALDNLVRNALHHGVPPVVVTGAVDGEDVQLSVRDQGPGVPQPLRDRLFERFATGDQRAGTGLGLFIARELARAHGGDATYDPDGGFVLRIPIDASRRTGKVAS